MAKTKRAKLPKEAYSMIPYYAMFDARCSETMEHRAEIAKRCSKEQSGRILVVKVIPVAAYINGRKVRV